MPSCRRRSVILAAPLVLLTGLSITALPAPAHEFTGGDLEILHPNAPPTPPGVSSAAGYLVVVNDGDRADRLIGGDASPFADDVEIHRTTIENDVSRMRRLGDGLEIPAGSTVRLDPGDTHLMFIGLTAPLVDGDRHAATLVFERAGKIEVEFAVEPFDTSEAPAETTDHGDMNHGAMDHGEMDHSGGSVDAMADDDRDAGETSVLDVN